jgi:hypothetical protein
VRVMRTRPPERAEAWGLLCFVGDFCILAAALGLGRDGFEVRYVTLFTPLLCAVYAVWVLYPPRHYGWVMPYALLGLCAAAVWPNLRYGVWYGRDLRNKLGWFENDLRAGVPLSELIARHHRALHPQQTLLHDYLPLLRDAGLGVFPHLRDDPSFQRLEIKPESLEITGASRSGNTFTHDGSAHLVFHLPKPVRVAGIQIRFRFTTPKNFVPYLIVQWRHPGGTFNWDGVHALTPTGDRVNWERGSYLRRNEPDPTLRCWFYQEIDAIDIRPDFWPGTFTIEECTLLLPAS